MLALAGGGVATTSAAWTLAAYQTLNARASISTVDAVPLVLRAGLTAALLWAVLLLLLAVRAICVSGRSSQPSEESGRTGGGVGRIALILLAATMTAGGLTHSTPAIASSVTTSSMGGPHGVRSPASPGRDAQAPVPGFDAPPPCTTPASPAPPDPGWSAPAPAPTHHLAADSASLLTGCQGHPGTGGLDAEVVVRRGDCLWTLVGRHLHTDDPSVIAEMWPRWYAANKGVIGPDPNLLRVGEVLRIPTTHLTP